MNCKSHIFADLMGDSSETGWSYVLSSPFYISWYASSSTSSSKTFVPQYFPPRMVFPHQYGGGSGPGRLHYLPPAANFTHQMPLHPYLVSGGRALQCLPDLSCACEDSLLFVLLCSYYVFWSRVIIFLTECQMFPLLGILPGQLLPKVSKVLLNRFCCFQIENVMV